MKISYSYIPDPDNPSSVYLMGMAFIRGQHRMTGVPVGGEFDEKEARKTIKRAFRRFRDGL